MTWSEGGSSPTSSSIKVPSSARSNQPGWSRTAPVKAPRAWPNSSDSRSASGRAPQLIGTNGLSRRRLFRWMARAISSLPVPLSPWISTVASESATCATMRITSTIFGSFPTMA
ncbi:MAG TPA: hypothetical protein DD490_03590 [Acidobacteria bacterium]|nr:hypothetical protein [Acidobacteriota bacterium]